MTCLRFLLAGLWALATASLCAAEVDFQRDVLPVLSGTCYACHGPDEGTREADLRLDVRDAAIQAGAIRPGDAEGSELLQRIFSDDDDVRMPPAHSGVTLTPVQKEAFKAWIESGAEYCQHWAFEKPRRPQVPIVPADAWQGQFGQGEHPIDAFVRTKLYEQGMKPSPEADRYSLVRRVYLDLVGLPPTPEQADAFVKDNSEDAFEKVVDALLASPQYGERWARVWLDVARYADTNGYEKDRQRTIWPYRDWVIRAINADMPFDQFTIEQLAGDLFENPTPEQLIATGFHRNTMLNEEGGIDPLEFRFYAMVDRVATTGAVWLGMTTGCAQCHTHKYDPITHTDYYQLFALLDDCEELELDVTSEADRQKAARIEAEADQLVSTLAEKFPAYEGDGPEAERRWNAFRHASADWLEAARRSNQWTTLRPETMSTNLPYLEAQPDGSIFASGDFTKRDVYTLTFDLSTISAPITGLRIEALPDERLPQKGPGRTYYEGRAGQYFLSELTARHNDALVTFDASSEVAKLLTDGNGSSGVQPANEEIGQRVQYVLPLAQPLAPEGQLNLEMLFERHFVASLGKFRISVTTDAQVWTAVPVSESVESILRRDSQQWSEGDHQAVVAEFLKTTPQLKSAREPIEKLLASRPETRTLIFQPRPEENRRITHRHHRGEFLSPKEAVEPGIPELFASMTTSPPHDRLAFARWLVSEDNPLVARVVVNRAWTQFFGRGLVVTPDDFGTQSEPPSHPELLDWLACEFMQPSAAGVKSWSMKALHRLIVTSATYRQESVISSAGLARDPENMWLARGPSHRLSAEILRDQMLKGSGLLSAKMYGPSVFPQQLQSVVADAYGSFKWRPSKGEDRYRRSLYTFTKRTAPFAAFTVFDAPTGENCTVKRDRSNTPLQALTLLNDEMYLEMARHAARSTCDDSPAEVIATRIFRRILVRPPRPEEVAMLVQYAHVQRDRCLTGELDAHLIMGNVKEESEQSITGDEQKNRDAQLAAWALVARVVMNLDEAVVKP